MAWWSGEGMDPVPAWLLEVGLEEFAPAFKREGFEGRGCLDELKELTPAQLVALSASISELEPPESAAAEPAAAVGAPVARTKATEKKKRKEKKTQQGGGCCAAPPPKAGKPSPPLGPVVSNAERLRAERLRAEQRHAARRQPASSATPPRQTPTRVVHASPAVDAPLERRAALAEQRCDIRATRCFSPSFRAHFRCKTTQRRRRRAQASADRADVRDAHRAAAAAPDHRRGAMSLTFDDSFLLTFC